MRRPDALGTSPSLPAARQIDKKIAAAMPEKAGLGFAVRGILRLRVLNGRVGRPGRFLFEKQAGYLLCT